MEEPQTEEPPANIQTDSVTERRRSLRIYFEKLLLTIGLILLAATLIGAGVYSNSLDEWYTEWGKYGTALFRTWIIVPLILSVCSSLYSTTISSYKQ